MVYKKWASDADRFWAKVNKTSACWLWTACRDEHGYGQFQMRGTIWKASRFAWTLTYGTILPGQNVLHRCDTPACVNPAHLFLGTQADNSADMVAKGRQNFQRRPELLSKGAEHGNSRLTAAQVLEIRELRRRGVKLADIARRFDVAVQTVCGIARRKAWTHV